MPPDTRARIEAAIAAAPDDPAAYGALADLLTESGDPRGEFVAAQLALENPTLAPAERQRLAAREAALLGEHEREWLGPLAEYLLDGRDGPWAGSGLASAHRWRRGHLDAVQIPDVTPRVCRCLAAAPAASRLRELTLLVDSWDDGYTDDERDAIQAGADELPEDVDPRFAGPWALLDAPFVRTIRVAQFGPPVDEDYAEALALFQSDSHSPHVADLVERMPAVEELRLLVHDLHSRGRETYAGRVFAAQNLTRLRLPQVYHADDCPIEMLAANPAFGRLESLLLHPHVPRPGDLGARLGVGGLRALGESPHLPSLRHLRYRLSDSGDAGCAALVGTGLLGRLRTLDLRHGIVTDAGLDALMASPGFGRLEWLDLSRNRLTDAGVRRLADSGVPHLATHQANPDPANAEEQERYLYAGDFE